MSDNTGIEWCDATWNPVTGCTEVSPGCDRCYAKTFAERWRGTPGHYFENGFDVQLRPDKLALPMTWRKPKRIFVNSMSDLFHDDVPDAFIAQVFAVMALAPEHTFQVLTKRHGRMRSLLTWPSFPELVTTWAWRINSGRAFRLPKVVELPLSNVWMGVSAENQQWANIRIPALLDTPAAVRFVSAEPLLGPINLHPYWTHGRPYWGSPEPTPTANGGAIDMQSLELAPRLDWVIVGGESGRGARPMHPDWARDLRDQCQAAGVAFLFKQWGEWTPFAVPPRSVVTGRATSHHHVLADGSGSIGTSEFKNLSDQTNWDLMKRVGKKTAGRELDGRTWDEYPRPVPVS